MDNRQQTTVGGGAGNMDSRNYGGYARPLVNETTSRAAATCSLVVC